MLLSMIVPIFKIFTSFLGKKGCKAPKHLSEYTICILPIILYPMLLGFLLDLNFKLTDGHNGIRSESS